MQFLRLELDVDNIEFILSDRYSRLEESRLCRKVNCIQSCLDTIIVMAMFKGNESCSSDIFSVEQSPVLRLQVKQ